MHDDELNPQAIQSALSSFDDTIAAIEGVGTGIKTLLQKVKDYQEKKQQKQDGSADQKQDKKESETQENISITVGRNTVYKGPVDGSGEFSLTEQQNQKITNALNNPSESKSSIKVLDSDRQPLLQITRTGEVVKDDLGAIAQAESIKQDSPQDIDFSQGQIPKDLGIPELRGVDPSKLAEVDPSIGMSLGFALSSVNAINQNRLSVGVAGTFPEEERELQNLQNNRESLMKQIKEKGYTNEQLLKATGEVVKDDLDTIAAPKEQAKENLMDLAAVQQIAQDDKFERYFPATSEALNRSEVTDADVAVALTQDLKPSSYPEEFQFLSQVRDETTTPHPIGVLAEQVRFDEKVLESNGKDLVSALKSNTSFTNLNGSFIDASMAMVRLRESQAKAVSATQEFNQAVERDPNLREVFPEFFQTQENFREGLSSDTPVLSETYQSPVGTVLDAIDQAPGLPLVNQATQAQENPTKLLSKDEQIEQLKNQLQDNRQAFEELSQRIDTLTDRMENLSPIKLANEQLNSWVNKQRNSLASAIRTGAERLAKGIERHDESMAKLTTDVKQAVEKFNNGMERHDQAIQGATDTFAEVRNKVSENYNNAAQAVGQKIEQAQAAKFKVTASEQYKKGKEFFESVANPAVKAVIDQLEKVGKVQVGSDGTRSLDSESMSWQVNPGGDVKIINKTTGTQVTPDNLDQNSLDTIKKFALVAQQRGYTNSQAQTESQQPLSQTSEQPKQVQSESQTIKV